MSNALRIDAKIFNILTRIKSKSERNSMAFAIISYAFTGEIPQDLHLNSQNILIFDIIKNDLMLKNQGGRRKQLENSSTETQKKHIVTENKEKVPHTPYKEIKISPKGDTKSFSDDFLKFWSAYPKQRAGNRDKAYSAYCRVLKERRATSAELLASAEKYANSDEVKRGFAKGCAAWLNDDRFLVEYGKTGNSSDYDCRVIIPRAIND